MGRPAHFAVHARPIPTRLGVPFPLAGAGVALGLRGREGTRPRLATAAVVIGALVISLAAGAYIVALLT